jgi:branched-chain amino acid transport system substrate-binding protein
VQYQGVAGNDVDQFRKPGKAVILYPPELKSGEFRYPYTEAQK